MSKKADNLCKKCQNPVLCDTPHNFVCENPTWIEDLLNDHSLWKAMNDDAFPEPISHEFLRLRSIFEQRQVFAMVFQIKDIGEVLMKFPVLCSAAYLKSDAITKKLIEKPLSLGDWQGIASELLKQSQHQYVYTLPESLRSILVDILRMYQKSLFVNQRNRFIGHGALGFDDNAEYRHYCENMLSAIAKHLDRVKEAYRHLTLSVNTDNDIFVAIDGETIALSPFIVCLGEELCFFDYLDGRKQPPPAYGLDYVSGGSHRRFEAPYLADVYSQLGCTFDADFVVENSVSDLEAENVLASMNEAVNFVDPTALSEWVRSNVVDECMGGVHILTMERGMGKTAFVYALESGIIELDDVKVCAYYCSHAQMRGVGNFIQGVMNALNGSLVETVYKALPRLLPDSENKSDNMLEVLQGYKAAYTRRGEGSKLLLILDGLDEIPADQADVFEYIPKSEDMPENTYILLTARNPKREQLAPYVVETLNQLSIGSHYEVSPESPENQATLYKYLSEQDMVKTEKGFRRPTNAEIERLLELSGNTFINLCVYSKLVSAGYAVDTLPELNNEQLFSYYLSVIHAAYGEKLYNEALRVLLLIATAYENLTLQELAYLCGYPGITLQLLAFIKDFGALIKAVRFNVRGTELAIVNECYREYVELNFADELQKMTVELVDRIETEDVDDYETEQGKECIHDGVLYLAAYIAEYVVRYADHLLESKEPQEKLWTKIEDCGWAVSGMKVYRLARKSLCYTGTIKLLQSAENENKNDLARVYMRRANAFCSLVRYAEAITDFSRVVEIQESIHREKGLPDENDLVAVYMKRALTYRHLNNHSDALADCDRATKIVEQLSQKDGLPGKEQIIFHLNRANLFRSLALYEKALEDNEQAIAQQRSIKREDELFDERILAFCYIERAITYRLLARYSEALADNNQAVDIMETLNEKGNLLNTNDLAMVYLERAKAYSSAKCYFDALVDCNRAVEIREQLCREGRLVIESDLAEDYRIRAEIHSSCTQYAEALTDYSRAVQIIEHMNKEGRLPNANDLALVYLERAKAYQVLNRYEEALLEASRAVEIREKLHKKGILADENDLNRAYLGRVAIYASLGCYAETLADYTRIINSMECLCSNNGMPNKGVLAIVYMKRAEVFDSLAGYSEALSDNDRAVRIYEQLLSEGILSEKYQLANAYIMRADNYASLEQYEKALADIDHAIEIEEQLDSENKLHNRSALMASYFCKALLYGFSGKPTEKDNECKKTVAFCKKLLPEIHEDLFVELYRKCLRNPKKAITDISTLQWLQKNKVQLTIS